MQKNNLFRLTLMAATLAVSTLSASAFAGDDAHATTRDREQQAHIEHGLQNGSLSSVEAGRLENQEGKIDRMEANANKDGNVSRAEHRQIQKAQNAENRRISRDEHNDVHGNPNSKQSQRLQKDVARNEQQDHRIARGERDGQLTHHEAANALHSQAAESGAEGNAERTGGITHADQAALQHEDNAESAHLVDQNHNLRTQ